MKGLIKLGAKNLLRYKRRTIITSIAVAMGLYMFIMMDSVLIGISEDSEINITRFETGSGKIVTGEYWDDFESMPLKETLSPEVADRLDGAGITWTPRIATKGDLIFRGDPWPEAGSLPVQIIAVDPERDSRVFDLERVVTEGSWLKTDEEGAVIGQWLAEDMGAELGYPISLRVKTRFGAEEVIELEVTGIMDCPDPYVNTGVVFMDLSVADDYLEMDGLITEAAVKISSSPALPRAAVAELRAAIDGTGTEFHPWEDWASDFIAIASGKQTSAYSILFLVILIAAIGISNTVLMSLLERTRELGMLRALGMTDGDLKKAFLVEAAGIGLIGGVAGMMMGAMANLYLVNVGIDYGTLFDMSELKIGYRFAGLMYGTWIWQDFVIALVGGVAICVAIAGLVTRKLNRMEITDCLRYT